MGVIEYKGSKFSLRELRGGYAQKPGSYAIAVEDVFAEHVYLADSYASWPVTEWISGGGYWDKPKLFEKAKQVGEPGARGNRTGARKVQNSVHEEYLRRVSYKVGQRLLENRKSKEFLTFLKWDFLTESALTKLLQYSNKLGETVCSA